MCCQAFFDTKTCFFGLCLSVIYFEKVPIVNKTI